MATVLDFSPLFRSSVGFDRVFDLLENASKVQAIKNWPPYDVVRTGDDNYRIVIAVPGFAEADLDLSFQANLLVLKGLKQSVPMVTISIAESAAKHSNTASS